MQIGPLTCALAVSSLVLALSPAAALGVITSAQTIDGPNADVLELGGVAMAEDGSGGLVYRKRVGGRAHVFASRFGRGRWQRPQQVDVGQDFDSSWPRIGAANGGKLVVTWVQEFGADTDRMFSATLDQGAGRFQKPVPVDLNVGEALGTYPSLAMNRGGDAYLAYRVPIGPAGGGGPDLPPGYIRAETRVARYNGTYWSVLGTPANRNPSSPVSVPTSANSPKVGIDVFGNGIVAFQEPDDEFIDRVWARRLFGSTFGIPLIVSPQQWNNAPLRGPADAFSLDSGGYGQAAVAFRQQPGERPPLPGAHVLVNTIPEVFRNDASSFLKPRIVDGSPNGPLSGDPGLPSVGVTSSGLFMVNAGIGQRTLSIRGDERAAQSPQRLDDGRSSVGGDPVVEFTDSEASVSAWKVRVGDRAGIVAREDQVDRDVLRRTVSASAGGPVNDLRMAGSGFGDALVGFLQGGQGAGQIAAATVNAPPERFAVQTPVRWVRSRRAPVTWDPAPNAGDLSSVSYAVVLGDEEVRDGLRGVSYRLRTAGLPNGRHDVVIVARDSAGQETQSRIGELKLDRAKPRARVRVRGRSVSVRIVDGRKRSSSGPRGRGSRIKFGDGKRASGKVRVRHRYKKPGTYRVVIKARDRAGNRRTIKRRVRVR
jgi:PKD domain